MALALWQLAAVVLLVFGSVLIAIFLRALADWIGDKMGFTDGWALLLVAVLLVTILGTGFYFGGQALAIQMAELSDRIPQSLEKLRERASEYEWGRWLIDRVPTSAKEVDVSS